jgi:hypothetical protein
VPGAQRQGGCRADTQRMPATMYHAAHASNDAGQTCSACQQRCTCGASLQGVAAIEHQGEPRRTVMGHGRDTDTGRLEGRAGAGPGGGLRCFLVGPETGGQSAGRSGLRVPLAANVCLPPSSSLPHSAVASAVLRRQVEDSPPTQLSGVTQSHSRTMQAPFGS